MEPDLSALDGADRNGKEDPREELRRLDDVASRGAVKRYARILQGARTRGLRVMLTLNHFTLPVWIHDPQAVRSAFAGIGPDDPLPADLKRAGWLDAETVAEFRKYAAYAAWKFGDEVNLWATLNEPMVLVAQGFVSIPGVTGVKAPGILSYPAALRGVENLGLANAAAYDAIHADDREARVGFVHTWPTGALQSGSAADATAPATPPILNRAYLGWRSRASTTPTPTGSGTRRDPQAAARQGVTTVGVNHYSPARAQSLGVPVTSRIPCSTSSPRSPIGDRAPEGPPCPQPAPIRLGDRRHRASHVVDRRRATASRSTVTRTDRRRRRRGNAAATSALTSELSVARSRRHRRPATSTGR